MVSAFSERAEEVRAGLVNPTVDNMLKITNDGRKCALDQRLLNELLPDAEKSKVNTCVENAFQVWDEGKADRTTQLIFCDLSTPKGDGTFNVYDDVRNKLTEKGIPKEEIAFIHEYNTEAKKAELFAKVRTGQVRILMGSTPKLGAGTNVQDRLIALHHLDCPWKPSDLEQQEGRILRQGNQNDKVKIFRYVTENTFDAYMWQILENKQKFISQIMTSKSPVRACEDVDDTALSYAEIKALATGNPHIKEKMDLDVQVSKLKLLKANHTSQIYRLESDIAKNFPVQISALKERIAGMQVDSQVVKSVDLQDNDTFAMTVGNVLYEDKKEAGEALIAACAGLKTVSTGGKVGEYHGFTLSASYNMFSNAFELTIKGKCSYKLEIGKDPVGNMQRIHNTLSSIDRKLTESEQKLETVQQQLATAQEEVKKPFPKEAELNEKMERLSELNALIETAEAANTGNFTDSQRNLIVNFAYKMDDKDEVLGLVNRMMTAIRRPESEYTRNLMNETQAQIDNFPDGMIGFIEMHEAGIRLEHMYPLEKNRAVELYREGAEVFLLHGNPDNPEQAGQILAETENAILGHDGIFGITRKQNGKYIKKEKQLPPDRKNWNRTVRKRLMRHFFCMEKAEGLPFIRWIPEMSILISLWEWNPQRVWAIPLTERITGWFMQHRGCQQSR